MRFITSSLLAVSFSIAGVGMAPASVAATCADSYFVCLNDNVYDSSGNDDELESIECGARYAACLFHIF